VQPEKRNQKALDESDPFAQSRTLSSRWSQFRYGSASTPCDSSTICRKYKMKINWQAIAVEAGDFLKYSTTVNEIGRVAGANLPCKYDDYPNPSITSSRAQLIYSWIISLGRHSSPVEERISSLTLFLHKLTPDEELEGLEKILRENGISLSSRRPEEERAFHLRAYHHEVVRHSKELFVSGNFFHAVFEATKAYNNAVKQKSLSTLDGEKLINSVFSSDKGVLKVTACVTETDLNIQDGIRYMSAGLMRAVRNPVAHENKTNWNVDRKECLDMLSLTSFLWAQLDKSTYYKK